MTDERRWRAVDGYFARVIVGADRTLEQALESNAAAGLPQIDVSPTHGKLLYLLMRMAGAPRRSKSARSAAIPPSGSLARCRRMGGS